MLESHPYNFRIKASRLWGPETRVNWLTKGKEKKDNGTNNMVSIKIFILTAIFSSLYALEKGGIGTRNFIALPPEASEPFPPFFWAVSSRSQQISGCEEDDERMAGEVMIKKINRLSFSDDCSGGGKKGRKKNGDEGKVNNDHFQHTRLNSNYIFLCISIIKSGFLCSALLRFFSARHSHSILHQKLYALQRPFKAPFTSVFCIQISAHHLSWWNCEFMALKRRVISETVSKREFHLDGWTTESVRNTFCFGPTACAQQKSFYCSVLKTRFGKVHAKKRVKLSLK